MLIKPFIDAITPYIPEYKVKTIVDIGSRDLEQALEFQKVYPQAMIHAFEPRPLSYIKCLEKANDKIMVYPAAILDRNGETDFYDVPQSQNHGASSIFAPTSKMHGIFAPESLEPIKVPALRMDTWAEHFEVPSIDLVWMDVQGAEIPALEGFGDLLKSVKAIATEAETEPLYQPNEHYGPTQYPELREYLESRGFKQLEYTQAWDYEADLIFIRKDLLC